METQVQTQTQARVVERPKKRLMERPQKPGSRRIGAALWLSRAVYRRMRQRAARDGLSFGAWLKRAALRELRRKPEF